VVANNFFKASHTTCRCTVLSTEQTHTKGLERTSRTHKEEGKLTDCDCDYE